MESFSINISSFGYKYETPNEANMIFDVRFLPNPFYVPELKQLTGNDQAVRAYVMKGSESKEFIEKLVALIDFTIPQYMAAGKDHVDIAFGCTGGHHRSVTIANEIAEIYRGKGMNVTLIHRELDK